MRLPLTGVVALTAACVASGSYLRDGRHAVALNEDKEQLPVSFAETGSTTQAKTDASWRFSTNYVPQHYGNWKFEKGNWNFGGDDRIECESCGYCLYYAVDQLGDNFYAAKVEKVLGTMSSHVQWVFQSACAHIVKTSKTEIVASMMKLVEPQETCRSIGYCAAGPADTLARTGATPISSAGLTINPVHPPRVGGAGTDMVTVQHPGRGFLANDGSYQMYPSPGARPIGTSSAMSPYNFGGYDAYGFPVAAPGVPSSTPPPPSSTIPGLGLINNPSVLAALSGGTAPHTSSAGVPPPSV